MAERIGCQMVYTSNLVSYYSVRLMIKLINYFRDGIYGTEKGKRVWSLKVFCRLDLLFIPTDSSHKFT